MDTQLTHAARTQLARSLRQRYQAASSRAKKQVLNEFIAVSGYHPKYAIHLLNSAEAAAPARRGRVRPTIYDDAAKQALIVLWEASDRICGKRLKPLLLTLVPALERHGHLKLDDAIRTKVLAMSAATIDRLLRAPRSATRNRKPRRVTPEIRRRVETISGDSGGHGSLHRMHRRTSATVRILVRQAVRELREATRCRSDHSVRRQLPANLIVARQ